MLKQLKRSKEKGSSLRHAFEYFKNLASHSHASCSQHFAKRMKTPYNKGQGRNNRIIRFKLLRKLELIPIRTKVLGRAV